MNSLEKGNSEPEIISKEELDRYKELSNSIKASTNDKDLLNKRIKAKLGDFVISNLQAAIEPHSELVDRYLDAMAQVSVSKLSGQEVEEAEEHLKAVYAELQLVGVSREMIQDYVSGDRMSALSHNKVALELSGYKVATIIQDRSSINQDKAAAFLKRLGQKKLLTTKIVVDEAALELAILNGEVDPSAFKQACIDEKLIVSLTVK